MQGQDEKEMNEQQRKLWAEDRKKYNLKYPSEDVIRFLKRNFETGEGKAIVDFGCGSGRNTIVMADMGFMIYAVDAAEECLELVKEKIDSLAYGKIEYIQNEDVEIPLPDESADCLVAWGVVMLCDTRKRERLFDEIHRVLKHGGCFLADYRTKEDSIYGIGTEIEKDVFCLDEKAGNLEGMVYWFPDKEDLLALYQAKGFSIHNLEKKEHIVNNWSKKDSYYYVWAKKGEDGDINE